MQTFRAQLVTNHRPDRPVIRKAHDYGGSKVHIATDPVPGEPLPKYRCERCSRDLPETQFILMHYSEKLAGIIGRKFARGAVLHPHCHVCRSQLRGRWVRHELYSPSLDRYWQKTTNHLRSAAYRRGIIFAIDKDDTLGMYLECRGICGLTGLQTDWRAKGTTGRNGRNYKAPSVDRIDSNGNYTLDNVQIVMQVVNVMKTDLPQDMFVGLCAQIARHSGELL